MSAILMSYRLGQMRKAAKEEQKKKSVFLHLYTFSLSGTNNLTLSHLFFYQSLELKPIIIVLVLIYYEKMMTAPSKN